MWQRYCNTSTSKGEKKIVIDQTVFLLLCFSCVAHLYALFFVQHLQTVFTFINFTNIK
jgi:hypothetical protein